MLPSARILTLLAGSALAIAGCHHAESTGDAAKKASAAARGAVAKAVIEGRSNSKLTGAAVFTEVDGKTMVVVTVAGAPPGTHAVHVHERGDCSAPDATSAKGHFNPTNHKHGDPNAGEHHAGDFGNMEVGADGNGKLELTTSDITVKEGPVSVLDRAIVIHEKADDMTTQSPPGNAGARIGCGHIMAAP
jgi:Cu-Zn family superoxide dismutase